MAAMFAYDVGFIGGAGHVGLPLALTMAGAGFSTVVYDKNTAAVESIKAGKFPFMEEGGPALLKQMLTSGRFTVSGSPEKLAACRFLVLVIGTPMDEYLNPRYTVIHKVLDEIFHLLVDGQILILRSTVYPGITRHVQEYLKKKGRDIRTSFCPERVAQGKALEEIRSLPQIISAFDPATLGEVRKLFSAFNKEIIELPPVEAELAKLMTNSWRYIQFAVTNQLYMIADQNGLDFNRIFHACRYKYPRMEAMPSPGYCAGPCLVKDTMQLAAYSHNNFGLGHMAMVINEGLPIHVVDMAKSAHDLPAMTAGVLGMAFKAEIDDPRDSLSYKLKKILSLECREVICTDPYVKGEDIIGLAQVLDRADILFVGAPHRAYHGLKTPEGVPVYDVWSCVGKKK